jgi:hypothetical protein
MTKTLRVAYIPEHFSTPLFLAIEEKFFDFEIKLVPVIEGSGRLINLLNADEVDIAIGLTEAFIADIGKNESTTYKIIDTFVKSALCWAISTGAKRDINTAEELRGKRIGVSRIGSGSYVMSYVLGLELKFPPPFYEKFPILSNFKNLRDSVNLVEGVEPSDAFMWEYFTSKKYYDNHEIKQIGEIYTPWPSWVITANKKLLENDQDIVDGFLSGLKKGIEVFKSDHARDIKFISENLDYSKEDATLWMKTVEFNDNLGSGLDWDRVVKKTRGVLKLAGVLVDEEDVIEKRLEVGVSK